MTNRVTTNQWAGFSEMHFGRIWEYFEKSEAIYRATEMRLN